MLSEEAWRDLLPQIRKALEHTKSPTGRWGHRRLSGLVLQLVAELEETRRQLSRKGCAHTDNVMRQLEHAVDELRSAAADVEDAADEVRSTAEELVNGKPIRNDRLHGQQEPWGSVTLQELLDTIEQTHNENHRGPFRFCRYSVCAKAKYAAR